MEKCTNCGGTGFLKSSKECPACLGLGVKRITDDYGKKRTITCFNCKVSGSISGEVECPQCHGTGKV